MRKIIITLVVLAGFFLLGYQVALLNTPTVLNENYYCPQLCVWERQSQTIKLAAEENKKIYPASLTKIMTAIVALEEIADLDELVVVDVATYQKMVAKNASLAGFYGREKVTYRDLLYGALLSSGGEAANSLAVNLAGSVENFVDLMNEKAEFLGLENTYFVNPEGLDDPGQYSTAHDLARLLDFALNNEFFREIITTKTYLSTPTLDHPQGLLLQSTVLTLLEDVNQEGFRILGGKSGTTSQAGECWAILAEKNGREYICVAMGGAIQNWPNTGTGPRDDCLRLLKKLN
ncbi:MAG TPA: D-alanyl-D-alanine carboxypeptidase [Clostridia bacterium]|jgi:D-alanyl-D-alanine carboxypeptidase (penicillin-binding protein 5/6)|nr:D-alanyl-D-alanine carboxypeptidase [Clostridia bacterium]